MIDYPIFLTDPGHSVIQLVYVVVLFVLDILLVNILRSGLKIPELGHNSGFFAVLQCIL